MTRLDLDDLEQKALAATPGPWVADERRVEDLEGDPLIFDGQLRRTDAAFIAAYNPQTALWLIRRVRELEGAQARAESAERDLETAVGALEAALPYISIDEWMSEPEGDACAAAKNRASEALSTIKARKGAVAG